MKGRMIVSLISCVLAVGLLLSACGSSVPGETATLSAKSQPQTVLTESQVLTSPRTGFITEQILEGTEGDIHYSYYLPENYDSSREYPLMMVMPGYDMMWFGEDSSGSNLNWAGVRAWTELDEDMIVVSAQLTDWGEKSARQAIELTEYFILRFSVDKSRVYAAGYSAGGETMSQAVSMRPDLYAAYLHGASQWDGTFAPVAENRVAVYIFMAENDEYYGSRRARDAYNGLYEAYRETSLSDSEIGQLLQMNIPDNAWFAERGIRGNYHGGGNVLFSEEAILDWIISTQKQADGGLQASGFSDVAADAWYADAVEYVRDNGLMNGTAPTIFNPNGTTSRGQIAAILYRFSGSPAISGGKAFPDVADTAYYANAIQWASANGIISGYANGNFGPNDSITRQQLAAILWRYAGSPGADAGQDYADESAIAAYASTAVDWARANGIINGREGNRFDPAGCAARAQVAVILYNYIIKE